jgi:tetratricopeptide (TPR) repeat protein
MNRKERRTAQIQAAAQRKTAPAQVGISPAFEQAINHGLQCYQAGRRDEAAVAFRKAIAADPKHPLGHSNLAVVLRDQGYLQEAVAAGQQATAADPNYSEAHNNLGLALADLDRHEEAVAALARAIALQPTNVGARVNITNSLLQIGCFDEAVRLAKEAVALKPEKAKGHSNLGSVLMAVGQLDEAISAFRHALTLAPDLAMAHKNLGLSLLLKGDMPEGWRECEWRWLSDQRDPRNYPKPLWRGEPLQGKTILLYSEQGLGDAFQFVRYAPFIAAATGAKVVLEVHKPLMRLMHSLKGVEQIIGLWESTPAFDYFQALMSVPMVVGTTLQNIPAVVPYLSADPERVARWRERLGTKGFKVGIVWRGKSNTSVERSRSVGLADLAPLAGIEGVRLISLQKDALDEPPDPLMAEYDIETLGQDFDSGPDGFVDTAAVMENLDLIITIDTSTAHLAGALGRPVWIALKAVPDWRWLMHGSTTPWYPTVRLYRQQRPLAWGPVYKAIADDLRALAAKAV